MSDSSKSTAALKAGLAVPVGAAGPALDAPRGYPSVRGPTDDCCGCSRDPVGALAVPPRPQGHAAALQVPDRGARPALNGKERAARIHKLELRMGDANVAFSGAISDCKLTLKDVMLGDSTVAALGELLFDVCLSIFPATRMPPTVGVLVNKAQSAAKGQLRDKLKSRPRMEIDQYLSELAERFTKYIQTLRDSLSEPESTEEYIAFLIDVFNDDGVTRTGFKRRLDEVVDQYRKLVLPIGDRRRAHDPRLVATMEFVRLLVCIKGKGLALVEYSDVYPAGGYLLLGYASELLKCAALEKHRALFGKDPQIVDPAALRGA